MPILHLCQCGKLTIPILAKILKGVVGQPIAFFKISCRGVVLARCVELHLCILGIRYQWIDRWRHHPVRAQIKWHTGCEFFSMDATADSVRSVEEQEILPELLQFLCGCQSCCTGSDYGYVGACHFPGRLVCSLSRNALTTRATSASSQVVPIWPQLLWMSTRLAPIDAASIFAGVGLTM